jgi:hypothetical protein
LVASVEFDLAGGAPCSSGRRCSASGALIARLVEHPAVTSMPRAGLLDWVAKADQDLRAAQVATSQKWAREGFARACARATYFRETATEGAYEADVIDVEALDRTIAEALAGLRPHLGV